MDFLTAAAAGKLAKLVHKLIELRAAASRRCNVTNENSAEQGLPLEDMDEAGLRHGWLRIERPEARTTTQIALQPRAPAGL